MRTLEELINTEDSFLPFLEDWVKQAKNKVEVFPCLPACGEEALLHMQVTTRSPLGAMLYHTGGILIDDGWIRVLGAGCERINRSIASWNKGKTYQEEGETPPYLLIADDAIGGFYALNGGYLGKDAGNIYYFSPDSNEWMPMGIAYANFLLFCFETDMNEFYQGLRWDGWQTDVKELKTDYAYSFFPFLWTKEARDINTVSRKVIPVSEVYDFNLGLLK